jgi:hypothetical protein
MLDIDSKPFGAGCVGALTLALTYIGGFTAWALLGVPLLVMVAYYLAFQPPSPDQAIAASGRASVRAADPFWRHGDTVRTCRTAGLFSGPAGCVAAAPAVKLGLMSC